MSTPSKLAASGFTFALLVLCSCTTTPPSPAISSTGALPEEVSINADAGRGSPIFVTLRLGSGEELPFLVDTGAPFTLLDKSLEPKLGKRVGSYNTKFLGGQERSGGLYLAPQLYLGKTPLLTAFTARLPTNVLATVDLHDLVPKTGRPMMGILGMDCLRCYCIQVDFQGAKLRFLDPARLKAAELGKSFALTYNDEGCPRVSQGALLGRKGHYAMIDIGYFTGDGGLEPRLLQRVRQQKSAAETHTANFHGNQRTYFPGCVWGGGTYTNLLIGEEGNFIGLRFLARHLVTLDFRNDKMYLRPTTPGPPAGDWYVKALTRCDSAKAFIGDLIQRGRLPGTRNPDFTCDWQDELEPNCITLRFPNEEDSSVYHYTVAAAPHSSAWKVQRGWRTDQEGHTIEEYPVP